MLVKQQSINKSKGLAAIELTLILPFMLLLMFSVIEFSRMIYQYNTLNQTVRDVTRYLTKESKPFTTDEIFISNDVALLANAILIGGNTSATTYLLPDIAVSSIPTPVRTNNGDEITIQVNNVYSFKILIDHTNRFVTVDVSYFWTPIFFEALPTFVSASELNLSFPLKVTYSMRV